MCLLFIVKGMDHNVLDGGEDLEDAILRSVSRVGLEQTAARNGDGPALLLLRPLLLPLRRRQSPPQRYQQKCTVQIRPPSNS